MPLAYVVSFLAAWSQCLQHGLLACLLIWLFLTSEIFIFCLFFATNVMTSALNYFGVCFWIELIVMGQTRGWLAYTLRQPYSPSRYPHDIPVRFGRGISMKFIGHLRYIRATLERVELMLVRA